MENASARSQNISVEQRIYDWVSRLQFGSLVRIIGSLLLIVSASSFMVEQVRYQSDAVRYLALLGHTLLLGLAGLFCVLKLNESRSARTFFALVLVSVPVHFSVLGGLVYSVAQWDHSLVISQPDLWIAGSGPQAALLVAGGVALLFPLTLFAMKTLARKHARSLSVVFFAVNALLLLPVRHPHLVLPVLFAGLGLVYFFDTRRLALPSELRTTEGRILRTLMIAPLAIAFARSYMHYQPTLLFISAVSLMASVVAYGLMYRLKKWGVVLQRLMTPAIIINTAVALVAVYIAFFDDVMFGTLAIALWCTGVSLSIAGLGVMAIRDNRQYYRAALLMFVVSNAFHMLVHPVLLTSVLAVTGALGGLFAGFWMRQKITMVVSLGALVVSVGYHLQYLDCLSAFSHWSVLLGLGVALIVSSALFDRHKETLLHRLHAAHQTLASFDY